MAGSPRIIARPTTRSPAACRRARVRQGQAFGGAEEAPSLTAAAPRRRWEYAVGTEECSRRGSNQRMECKGRPDWRDAPLTKKAPYKPDGRQRPLAVAALEDKIVQRATTALLNAIYEEDFLGFSYGFRPGRGTHNALDALCVGID